MDEEIGVSGPATTYPTDRAWESKSIRIFILAQIHLYSRTLAQFLGAQETLRVVDMTGDLGQALDGLGDLRPDIILLDMALPNSALALRRIANAEPNVKILAFGVSPDERNVAACARARVSGYVSAEEDPEELVVMIHSVARGELRCSPRMAGALLDRVAVLATEDVSDRVDISLTARELEVLELIERGLSNKEIARALSIELPTVKNHVHNIFAKLNVNRRTEAVARLKQ
jgi:two-component system nitrate/nitrite response regulator NarL